MDKIKTFEAMLARGQDSDMLRYTLGNAYFDEKNYAKAIEHLQAAVAIKPDYSNAWKVLARVYAQDEQLEQALETFDRALAVAQDNGDKQVEKEISVFRKRVVKALDAAD